MCSGGKARSTSGSTDDEKLEVGNWGSNKISQKPPKARAFQSFRAIGGVEKVNFQSQRSSSFLPDALREGALDSLVFELGDDEGITIIITMTPTELLSMEGVDVGLYFCSKGHELDLEFEEQVTYCSYRAARVRD
jgi:hypothetical protein